MLSILPAMAVLIGFLVLGQRLSLQEGAGVALVMAGLVVHRPHG